MLLLVYSFSWENFWACRNLGRRCHREVVRKRMHSQEGSSLTRKDDNGTPYLFHSFISAYSRGRKGKYIVKVVVCNQETLEIYQGISTNRVLWSPDGSLFGMHVSLKTAVLSFLRPL